MMKINVNVAAMRHNQPGVRLTMPNGERKLYNRLDMKNEHGDIVASVITEGGSAWLETYGLNLIGTRRGYAIENAMRTPFEEIDWGSIQQAPNHQLNFRLTPTGIYTNDSRQIQFAAILPERQQQFGFFFGHDHIHVEEFVDENNPPTETELICDE